VGKEKKKYKTASDVILRLKSLKWTIRSSNTS